MGRQVVAGKSEASKKNKENGKNRKNSVAFHRWSMAFTVFSCLLTAGGALFSCAESVSESPRKVVIELFGAMERNERAELAGVVDIAALMEPRQYDYALNLEKPRVFTSPQEIFADLTDSGLTKQTWFKYQRIVGDEEISGDTAYVDVSFVDKETGKQTFNKFGVRKIGQVWRIFSFRTLVAPQDEAH